MAILTSIALVLLPLLYPATSSRVYEDVCPPHVNASEGDKYNAVCLVLFIYYHDTTCHSEHFYKPSRSKEMSTEVKEVNRD
ncbi:hypothetical protein GCK32_022228 [Trichostrongylus colubriformis]|uniref:Uncharacterized protein n=1 Tax=Trichostrongylus colubriformis TaxID=6319 RepID=A0AAN8F0Q8_TRICO